MKSGLNIIARFKFSLSMFVSYIRLRSPLLLTETKLKIFETVLLTDSLSEEAIEALRGRVKAVIW